MIPKIGFGSGDIEITEQPTLTHRMDREKESIKGKTDETEAMKQAVLTTESVVANIKDEIPPMPAGNPGMGMM